MNVPEQYIKDHHYHWKGIRSGQHKKISSVFTKTFMKQFAQVIELGAGRGALSMLLARSGVAVYAYEVDKECFKIKDAPKNLKVIFKNYNDCMDEISKLANKEGKTLILCDGGQKIKDFYAFARILKSEDVIMIHDYGEDTPSFREKANAISWCWGQEVSFSSIRGAVASEKLQKWEYDRFLAVLWGAFRRT